MYSACGDLQFENVAEIKQKEVTSLSVKKRHALTRAFSECGPALHCWPGGQLPELSVQTAELEWPLAAGLCLCHWSPLAKLIRAFKTFPASSGCHSHFFTLQLTCL